jgi:hypothetical protein
MAPALVLCAIGAPSFALLYGIDELNQPEVTPQGYWPPRPPNSGASGVLGPPDALVTEKKEAGYTAVISEKRRGWRWRLAAGIRTVCGPRS